MSRTGLLAPDRGTNLGLTADPSTPGPSGGAAAPDDPLALATALLRVAETVADPLPLVAAARSLLESIAPRWGRGILRPLTTSEWG